MITVNKQTLINLIQAFIVQGADDQINFGHILSPEEYNESIELQLKQIEIIIWLKSVNASVVLIVITSLKFKFTRIH
jgi:plastocyanin domain-containing protein